MKKILLIVLLIAIGICLLWLGWGKKSTSPTSPTTTENRPANNPTIPSNVSSPNHQQLPTDQPVVATSNVSSSSTTNPTTNPVASNTPIAQPTQPTAVPSPQHPIIPISTEIVQLLNSAEQSLKKGELGKAWQQYSLAMRNNLDSNTRKKVSAILNPIVAELCSKTELTNCMLYSVQSGDSLTKIAKKHKTTIGLLRELNQKYDDNIRIGQKIKVIPQNLMIEVYKRSFFLVVYLENGLYYRSYEVGLGKDDKTPVGDFVIKQKEKNPVWTMTDENGRRIKIPFNDPRHKIGTRWMGFDHDGIGIHGTVEPDSIGKNMSNGCVRLRNEEVEKLFELVDYTTQVKIKP